nr:putative toxin-antitoxin system toxin component, PIN family [Candidatus Acidoferrales bacterium]
MRCVFDTNVLVSALLKPESKPRQALQLAGRHGKVLLSFATLAELNEVLTRQWLRQFVSEEIVRSFLAGLTLDAELVDVDLRIAACRDAKDDKFLELAANGRATRVITGDSDLLVLNPFRGIQIVSPNSFLELPFAKGPEL